MRILTLVLGFVISLAACAEGGAAPEKYREGEHYKVLDKPVRTLTKDKIEVIEAFSYTCSHCYDFEPLIKSWVKKAPEDVAFSKLPVIWRPANQFLARILYTAEALGIEDKVNARVFQVFHIDKKNLTKEDQVAEIFAEFDIDKEKFKKTFNSFGVSSKVNQADSRTRGMKITGTPQLVVDGRYVVAAKKGLGHSGMLNVVDFLIEKVRAERAK